MGQATSLDELRELLGQLFPNGSQDNDAFVPRPTDVIISPTGKSGTTWLQQMVHSIRTDAEQDYEDIYEVVPWIDLATQLDLDLDADQPAEPRAFKSHANWDDVPKGCRYIVSFRDPKDALVSAYRFFEGWLLQPGLDLLEEFVAASLFREDITGTYWHHTISWLNQRDNPDVLLLTFDDMKQDRAGVVRLVAAFLAVPADEKRLAFATERSSFAHMSANPGPFSDPWLRDWSIEHLDLPADSDASKVREGRVGTNRQQLAPETAARIDERWAETVGATTGVMSYEELVDELRAARETATPPRER